MPQSRSLWVDRDAECFVSGANLLKIIGSAVISEAEFSEHSMKLALCYPPTEAVTVMPPLGIGYLASCAEKHGHPTDIYDLAKRRISADQLALALAEKHYDVIGLSISTPNFRAAETLIQAVRRHCPKAALVVGGPHPSALPDRTLKELDVDYLVAKEGEISFPNMLDVLSCGEDPVGQVPGILALRDKEPVGLPAGAPPQDLDAIPWPAWEKLEPHRYPPIPHQMFVRRLPVAPVLTSRGCPMACSFCCTTSMFGKAIRTRSPESVVEEMRFLKDRFGIREIHFEDDNMTLSRKHALALMEKIAEANLGLYLKFPNGVMTSTMDAEMLRAMKKAGCYQISLGIETTSPELEEKECKFLPNEKVREVVANARREGLEVQGLFVVGLPYDSTEGVRRTVRDAIAMKIDLAHFGIYIPLPGSDGTQMVPMDMYNAHFFTPYSSASDIPPKTLKALQRWAILKFYLRPRPILKLLSMFKIRQLGGVLNIIRRYLVG
jgi:radical SAM superfamily enzyme YgiQ (UPF0313 family)